MNTDGNLTDRLGGLLPSIVGVADWFEEYFLKPSCRHVGTNKHENLFSGEIIGGQILTNGADLNQYSMMLGYTFHSRNFDEVRRLARSPLCAPLLTPHAHFKPAIITSYLVLFLLICEIIMFQFKETAIYQLFSKPSKNFRYAFHILNRDSSPNNNYQFPK